MSSKFGFVVTEVNSKSKIHTDVSKKVSTRPERQDIRRPLDTLSAREDSYATLSLRIQGAPKQLRNTSNPSGSAEYNANLLVQAVQFQTQEKSQLAQTFDRDRMFFFGQALPTVNVTAKVLEDETFQWLHEFHHNYVKHIGGSKSAEQGAQVQFKTEDKIFSGYITSMNFSRSALDRHTADLSFSLSVTQTRFTRKLSNKASVLRAVDAEGAADILKDLAALQGEQSALLRNRTLAKSTQTLKSQLSLLSGSFPDDLGDTFTRKDVPLRDAYSNEFPYTPTGQSYDELGEANAISNNDLLALFGDGVLLINVMDDHQGNRDALIKAAIDERVHIETWRDKTYAHAASEDVFTPYVEPVPVEISPFLAAAKRVGSAAALLAITSISTSLATEALTASSTGAKFSLERAGKRMMDKAFGTSMVTPPFDDSRVFT